VSTRAATVLAETCRDAVSSEARRVLGRRGFCEEQCAASARNPERDLDSTASCVSANLALRATGDLCNVASRQKCRHVLMMAHMRQSAQGRHAKPYCAS